MVVGKVYEAKVVNERLLVTSDAVNEALTYGQEKKPNENKQAGIDPGTTMYL